MILVDTSVWIEHLQRGHSTLTALLQDNLVCTHDFVIGEIACGNFGNRAEVIGLLQALPRLAAATDDEILFFIERQHLAGLGVGYIDVHLLAATVMHSSPLWTNDKPLKAIADDKGCSYIAAH